MENEIKAKRGRGREKMPLEEKREKYVRVRMNEEEFKEFTIACNMMEMTKTEVFVRAVKKYLREENIDIWQNMKEANRR